MEYKAGMRFGNIVLLEDTGKRDGDKMKIFKCRCDCGKEFERSMKNVYRSASRGSVVSCGCMRHRGRNIGLIYRDNPDVAQKRKEAQGLIAGTMICNINRKHMNKNNTSGYRGVSYIRKTNKWQASIRICGKATGTKNFDRLEDAVKHRQYLEDTFFKPFIEEYEAQKREADNDKID